LFNVSFDVLLYDLTSTYFEADPPFPENDKRRYGYSRDHRPDCVQVVIALVVTPEGLPLVYEVMAGNTRDNATLRGFLERIERQYGKARRIGAGVLQHAARPCACANFRSHSIA
jgi:transposase